LPDQLAKLPQYPNLVGVYSSSETVNDLGNLCSYENVTAGTAQTYLHIGSATTGATHICAGPEGYVGKKCPNGDSDCNNQPSSCQLVTKAKDIFGLEGMCLEYDVLNPLYANIYQDTYNEAGGSCSVAGKNNQADCEGATPPGVWTPGKTYSYQPYACLTYFPFTIDLCSYHSAVSSDCTSNPDCKLNAATTACIAK